MANSPQRGLRTLCQTLLNGSPDRSDLRAAEDFLNSALTAVNGKARQPFGKPWEPANPPPPGDAANRRIVLQALAPALLLDGLWLARAAQPATAHRTAENLLFELYCRTMGLDDPARSPPLRFRASLVVAGVYSPTVDGPGFFHGSRFPDFALPLPALHLCLRHRPRTFFPELLGYTLAHVHRQPAWWDVPESAEFSFRSESRTLAAAALDAYPNKEAHEERIHGGWNLYCRFFDDLLQQLGGYLSRRITAEDAMADLVRAKRPHAVGYHARVMVGGRSLDQWLAEGETDFRPLLRALRDSPEIDQSCPGASRLIRAMDFGGAMFGVFDEKERRTCLEWIEDPERLAPNPHIQICGSSPPTVSSGEHYGHVQGTAAAKLSRRQLYTALLRAESPADCPISAGAFVNRILRRTRWLNALRRSGFPYSPETFHNHIETRYRREVDRYRPLSGSPGISKEYCRWAALQLAPAILVDGSWLAGIATASEKLGDTGRHLLRIYADELGNGRPDWNHSNVYRRLLESLGFDLPPFDSDEFAHDPGFLDTAFDIPVYLLAMGLLADLYFPELLGLNLAIELSGLGAGYMQTADILRHHGIDPAILQLHLSIDNLSSGHAARAREAIVLYLDEIRRREGAEAVQFQWKRIWMGYLSLNTAALGLTANFMLRYFRDRGCLRFKLL
jgi:hypothetical protein